MFRRILKVLRDLAGLDDSPHKIALGLALGIFVGFVPIMGIQMAVVLPFVLLLRGNKMAAVAGVWITNPVTVVPIYYLNYLLGLVFTRHQHLRWSDFAGLLLQSTTTRYLDLGERILVPLFVGGCIIGVVAAVPTYFVTRHLVIRVRQRRRRRRERSARQQAPDPGPKC